MVNNGRYLYELTDDPLPTATVQCTEYRVQFAVRNSAQKSSVT
jgi:hypothetical protein